MPVERSGLGSDLILHVISGLGTGGAETMLVNVATALQRRGLPQHVVSVSGRGENARRLEAGGVAVTDLDLTGFAGLPGALWRLRNLIAQHQPSAIQGWMYHGNVIAALGHRAAPRRHERELYWGLRASDMDAERYGRINWLSAKLSRWPDAIISNSTAGSRFHIGLGYRPRRLEIIPNGIDCSQFGPDGGLRHAVRSELGIDPGALVTLHVARVDPMKDHATFLAAMRQVPHVTGLLVGLGTERLTLPPNVRALGRRSDVGRLYCAADIVISSSAYGEGFSNILGEGMASGLIPIATDVGDSAVIVGDTGHILAPRDAAGMAASIMAIAGLTPEARIARGAAARSRIEKDFALAKAIDAFARLYVAPVAALPVTGV